MRIAFLTLILLHGLIHLLGFIKGFDLKEVKALSLPISKAMGLLWLIATILFLLYSYLNGTNHKYAWFIGFIAVVVSQFLIVLFWKDAKFGTLVNLIILIVASTSYGHYNFQQMVQKETIKLFSQNKFSANRRITEKDLVDLPLAIQKWLRSSNAVGKPYIKVGKVKQEAKMKMNVEQENWLKATAVQYSTIHNPAFIWIVDVKMNPFIHFQGRDKFEAGKGEMLIKLNALINIVNEKGGKINEGSAQRFLGEMVWFPSLALSPYISWQEINDSTAIATINFKGTQASGTFYFNATGDFVKYSAMRYRGNEADAKRYEWVLEVKDYKTFEGIKVPSKMTATWKLEDTDWTWLVLEIKDINYNKTAIN